MLGKLKALGVRLAIDDFGTGYSSLSYLQRFPVDVLKIDKSFIDRIGHTGDDAAVARTITRLGRALGLETVAEGFEAPEQQSVIAAMGCHHGQGYHFAKPLDADAVTLLLDDHSPDRGQPEPGRPGPDLRQLARPSS